MDEGALNRSREDEHMAYEICNMCGRGLERARLTTKCGCVFETFHL